MINHNLMDHFVVNCLPNLVVNFILVQCRHTSMVSYGMQYVTAYTALIPRVYTIKTIFLRVSRRKPQIR